MTQSRKVEIDMKSYNDMNNYEYEDSSVRRENAPQYQPQNQSNSKLNVCALLGLIFSVLGLLLEFISLPFGMIVIVVGLILGIVGIYQSKHASYHGTIMSYIGIIIVIIGILLLGKSLMLAHQYRTDLQNMPRTEFMDKYYGTDFGSKGSTRNEETVDDISEETVDDISNEPLFGDSWQ